MHLPRSYRTPAMSSCSSRALAGVRSFSPLRSLLPDVAEKAEHQEVTVTGVASVQPTHSRAAFACSTLTAAARRTCVVAPRAPGAAAVPAASLLNHMID